MSEDRFLTTPEGDLPNTEPQAPRSIPLSQVGDNREGNKPYNGDASDSHIATGRTPGE